MGFNLFFNSLSTVSGDEAEPTRTSPLNPPLSGLRSYPMSRRLNRASSRSRSPSPSSRSPSSRQHLSRANSSSASPSGSLPVGGASAPAEKAAPISPSEAARGGSCVVLMSGRKYIKSTLDRAAFKADVQRTPTTVIVVDYPATINALVEAVRASLGLLDATSRIDARPCDLRDGAAVNALFQALKRSYARLDLLVNDGCHLGPVDTRDSWSLKLLFQHWVDALHASAVFKERRHTSMADVAGAVSTQLKDIA